MAFPLPMTFSALQGHPSTNDTKPYKTSMAGKQTIWQDTCAKNSLAGGIVLKTGGAQGTLGTFGIGITDGKAVTAAIALRLAPKASWILGGGDSGDCALDALSKCPNGALLTLGIACRADKSWASWLIWSGQSSKVIGIVFGGTTSVKSASEAGTSATWYRKEHSGDRVCKVFGKDCKVCISSGSVPRHNSDCVALAVALPEMLAELLDNASFLLLNSGHVCASARVDSLEDCSRTTSSKKVFLTSGTDWLHSAVVFTVSQCKIMRRNMLPNMLQHTSTTLRNFSTWPKMSKMPSIAVHTAWWKCLEDWQEDDVPSSMFWTWSATRGKRGYSKSSKKISNGGEMPHTETLEESKPHAGLPFFQCLATGPYN